MKKIRRICQQCGYASPKYQYKDKDKDKDKIRILCKVETVLMAASNIYKLICKEYAN
jgi:hypothetical protein